MLFFLVTFCFTFLLIHKRCVRDAILFSDFLPLHFLQILKRGVRDVTFLIDDLSSYMLNLVFSCISAVAPDGYRDVAPTIFSVSGFR
jgi:hypothetical protein